jgi:hypothetical protein
MFGKFIAYCANCGVGVNAEADGGGMWRSGGGHFMVCGEKCHGEFDVKHARSILGKDTVEDSLNDVVERFQKALAAAKAEVKRLEELNGEYSSIIVEASARLAEARRLVCTYCAQGVPLVERYGHLSHHSDDWKPTMFFGCAWLNRAGLEVIKEHDRVVLKDSVPEKGLVAGDVGTVIHIYKDSGGLEVEFIPGVVTLESILVDKVRDLK